MLFRDHPLFYHRGVPSWPPVWTWVGDSENKCPRGEIGILKAVEKSNIQPANRCFLFIEHEGAAYIGCLFCDDHAFCTEIVKLLEANRNKTIAEIGSLDVTFTL
jgi:hypothetical protein